MNKLLVFSLMLLLLVSLVSASSGSPKIILSSDDFNTLDNRVGYDSGNGDLLRATNRFRERINISCDDGCVLELEQVDSVVERYSVSKVEQVRFLGMDFSARESFVIDSDGVVLQERNNFMQTLRNWGLVKNVGDVI